MNYCTIQDAWGIQIEKFTNNDTKKIENENNTNYFNYDTEEENYDTCNCDILLNHIKKCPKCYNKIKNYFKPKIIQYYYNIIEDNKDIITLILIGLFILLFYKLINNLTKS
jgi:uncharacterized membrane protein YraQ (UPF0718 family)